MSSSLAVRCPLGLASAEWSRCVGHGCASALLVASCVSCPIYVCLGKRHTKFMLWSSFS